MRRRRRRRNMRMCRIRPITNSPMIIHILRVRVRIRVIWRRDGDGSSLGGLLNWVVGGGGWEFKEWSGDDGGSGLLDPKEVALIKLSTFWDVRLFGPRIVELPALVVRRVANDDALLHVGPKTSPVPLVLLNVDIGNTTPDMQHRDIRLGAMEGFPRCLSMHSRGGGPVPHMDKGAKGFSPEWQR
jgi:hypothetical protein